MTATRGGFDSETALAAVVVACLEHEGWDVFQEVESPAGLCDLVAVRGSLVWSVETKLAFGTAVVEQAHGRLRFAHLVSVATPRRRGSPVLEDYCRWQGIGWLQVDDPVALDRRPPEACVSEVIAPGLHRRIEGALRAALRPEHKVMARAGTNRGGYFTRFKDTCSKVTAYVRAHPGTTFKGLLDGIETHYAHKGSARAHLAHWVEAGKVEGVRIERDRAHGLRLWPR
jgi:hypothetical protein